MSVLTEGYVEYAIYLGLAFLGCMALGLSFKRVKEKKSISKKALSEEERLSIRLEDIKKDSENKVKDLYPTYSKRIEQFLESKDKNEKEWEKLKSDHIKIGELLLRNLISLDDIECSHLPEIRKQRKDVIRFIQSIIKDADEQWNKIKGIY